MKYQEQDSLREKDRRLSNNSERILTRAEGTELCRWAKQKGKEFRAYMEMMEAQEQAEKEAQKKD